MENFGNANIQDEVLEEGEEVVGVGGVGLVGGDKGEELGEHGMLEEGEKEK